MVFFQDVYKAKFWLLWYLKYHVPRKDFPCQTNSMVYTLTHFLPYKSIFQPALIIILSYFVVIWLFTEQFLLNYHKSIVKANTLTYIKLYSRAWFVIGFQYIFVQWIKSWIVRTSKYTEFIHSFIQSTNIISKFTICEILF